MQFHIKSVLASFALLAASMNASAKPVAWIVSDEDSQMVLFPTVHALPDGLEWQSEVLDQLIASADEVWLEIADTESPELAQEIESLVATYGMSSDGLLSSKLSEEQFAELELAASRLGLPIASLEPMQPWLAALVLTQADFSSSGISGDNGVETVLTGKFGGREIRGLETATDQTRMLAQFEIDVQVQFLMSAVESVGQAGQQLLEISEDWANGNLDSLETELIREFEAEFPDVYEAMFTDRNLAWADILISELEGNGTDFVAVGAGHLLGEDSVVSLLANAGYDVEQISLADALN